MDFWHVTNDFLNTTSLNEKTKKEMMNRIHTFSIQLNDTITLYPIGTEKVNQKTYDAITIGLKESVRRAKISLAHNKKHSKPFTGYWKFLADVLKEDAQVLKDEHLQNAIQIFETSVSTIKLK
jgi:hypothetical protein